MLLQKVSFYKHDGASRWLGCLVEVEYSRFLCLEIIWMRKIESFNSGPNFSKAQFITIGSLS